MNLRLFKLPAGEVDAALRSVLLTGPLAITLALPGNTNGYRVYRGVGSIAAINWISPAAFAPAGVAVIALTGLGHVAWTEYWYGLKAVSAAGIEQAQADRVVRVIVDDEGNLVGPPPNDVLDQDVSIAPAAGGKVRLVASYNAVGQAGAATGLQVARVVAGTPDWDNLLAVIAIRGSARIDQVLATVFGDGVSVTVAVRAVTALNATAGHGTSNTILADATAPAAVEYLEASQA